MPRPCDRSALKNQPCFWNRAEKTHVFLLRQTLCRATDSASLGFMRCFMIFCLLALPARAWEFSPTPVCTLDHSEPGLAAQVTYDHATQLYAISLTRPQGWPDADVFSIRFDGARPLTISTSRHRVNAGSLRVTDTGFGNVLNGLRFNSRATAFTPDTQVDFSLDGAAGPVDQFRACTAAPVA